MKLGVVLLNLGGPTSEESVKTFLYNLFRDEDIIKLGGGFFQELIAKTISTFRAKKVAVNYKEINACPKGCTGSEYCLNRQTKEISTCCSPINPLTEKQRKALEKALRQEFPSYDCHVYTAMRYWRPFAHQALEDIKEDGITHLILLPLYPQFSWTTTGSSFRDWEDVKKKYQNSIPQSWQEFYVNSYHLNPIYINAFNQRIDEVLLELDDETRAKTHLVFSAHGTPVSEVESGDPYTKQIKETVEAIINARGRKEQYWLSYQSKVGPAKWTQPNTEELVFKLINYGIKHLLMVPVAFVTDHIETLVELGIELPEDIEKAGLHVEYLSVVKGLNDHPLYIQALVEEVAKQIRHHKPKAIKQVI